MAAIQWLAAGGGSAWRAGMSGARHPSRQGRWQRVATTDDHAMLMMEEEDVVVDV